MIIRIPWFFFLFFPLLFAGTRGVHAQVIASPSVAARIVTPVAIPANVNSEFGNVAVVISGMVEVSAVTSEGSPGVITLPVGGGTFTAAAFYFAGPQGYAFTVNTPTRPLIVRNNNHPLLVSSFESTPAQNGLSGTINGVYISVSPSRVTVNYN